MIRVIVATLFAVIVPDAASAQAAAAPQVNACSLLPKEEVKKYFPWMAALDSMPVEETSIGTSGSSCTFPTVEVQVLHFAQATIGNLRKSGGLESVAGVGDAAYLRNNRDAYAEIYVKVSERMLTLQASIDGDYAEAKPRLIELAKAYVAKLR